MSFLLAVLPILPSVILQGLGLASEALRPFADRLIEERKAEVREAEIHSERTRAVAANATAVRVATASHWEQRALAFVAGLVPIAHFAAIGIGTTFAAPMKALGHTLPPWLEATLYVPAMPPPFDAYEGPIILSFYGAVGAVGAAKAIAGAIAMRSQR